MDREPLKTPTESLPSRPSGLSKQRRQIRQLTYLALLFALCLLLSWLEGLLPPPPTPFPLRYGLANIVVMFALLFLRPRAALLLSFLKSGFALLSRGLLAGLLSFTGSLCSLLLLLLLLALFRQKISYFLLSCLAALAHSMAQFFLLYFFYISGSFWVMYPYLVLSSLLTGCLTAFLLQLLFPFLMRAKSWAGLADQASLIS